MNRDTDTLLNLHVCLVPQCKFVSPPTDFHAPALVELDLSRTAVSDFEIGSFLARLTPGKLHTAQAGRQQRSGLGCTNEGKC
jgi:hypothetical protein